MIACLTLPYFAASVEKRSDDMLARQTLVMGGQPWESKIAYAFCQEAALRGVEPGMMLRLIHRLSPQAQFLPADQPRYESAAGDIVNQLLDFTPLVEPEMAWQAEKRASTAPYPLSLRTLPARYCLDLENLPLKEALPLAREMGRTVRDETRLSAAVGLAPTRLAAQLAAAAARPGRILPVKRENSAAFLAQQSIQHLPLPLKTARRLQALGIKHLGDLRALPPASVELQFGPEARRWQQLALGEEDQPLQPFVPPGVLWETFTFDHPVSSQTTLEHVVARLARLLAEQLKERHEEGGLLQLVCETEKAVRPPQQQPLRQPTARRDRIEQIAQTLLQKCRLTEPVETLTLSMTGLTPAGARQLSLFEPAAGELSGLLDTMAAKHGAGCFYRPVLTDAEHPLPERRFELTPLKQGARPPQPV